MKREYGLKNLSGNKAKHAVVVLHGIRQIRWDIESTLGVNLVSLLGDSVDVYSYGYDHTHYLTANGTTLATALDSLDCERIDLVGYSMGGLVARLAATDGFGPEIHTVVTLATPNRGSLSNAELTTLGQITRGVFSSLISPMVVRSRGVLDLTKASEIMRARYDFIVDSDADRQKPAQRYASIPALYYNEGRTNFSYGPSFQMNAAQALFAALNLKKRLVEMDRSHDGIVTEKSNNIQSKSTSEWFEFHLSETGNGGEPSRCHAAVPACADADHASITKDTAIAELIAMLLREPDWRNLEDPMAGNEGKIDVSLA